MYFYTPIFTLFLLERSLSLSLIVAAQTAFSIAMMLSVVPTGILADKFGQKVAIQIGLLIDALSMFSLLFIHSILGLVVFFIARGISIGFRAGSDEALLYDSHLEKNLTSDGYNKEYAKLISNDILGFVVATALSGIFVYLFGRSAYIPLIAVTSISSIVALFISSTLSNKKTSTKHQELSSIFSNIHEGIKVVKKDHIIFVLTVVGLLTINGEYFLRQVYQPVFQDMAVPALFLGVALSVGKIVNFISIRNVHRLEKFLTVDKIIFWLNILLGGFFMLFASTTSVWVLVTAFIGVQTLLNMQKPIISDYINQQISSEKRSTVLSTVSLVENLGEIMTRLMLGAAIGLIGLNFTLLSQGIYLVIGAGLSFWLLKRCGCVHKIKPHETSMKPSIIAN